MTVTVLSAAIRSHALTCGSTVPNAAAARRDATAAWQMESDKQPARRRAADLKKAPSRESVVHAHDDAP